MEITNSQILQSITDKKNAIKESSMLLEKISSLSNIDTKSIDSLKSQLHEDITDFKELQYLIQQRNFNNVLEYNGQETSVFKLIKIKEKYMMFSEIDSILIAKSSNNDDFLKIALTSYQDTVGYKKEISKIQSLLNKFNNEPFTKETYE